MRTLLALTSAALLTALVGASSAFAGLLMTQATTADRPGAETREASNIDDHSARLNGKVNPQRRPTTYHFEWGRTSAYGSRTSATAAGRGESGVSAAATISGLSSGTSYHFRLVAESDAGITYGADRTFSTTGAPAAGDPGTTPTGPGTTPTGPGTTPTGPGTTPTGPGTATPSDPGAAPGDGGTTPGGGTAAPGAGPAAPGDGPTDVGPGGQPDAGNQLVIGGQPKKHKHFAVAPTAGRISVDPPGPGGFVPLVEGVSVPIGSIVDARKGTAAITTQLDSGRKQTGEFWGERFKVRQPVEEGGLTEIRVRDAIRACDGKSVSATDKIVASRKKKRRRGLWGRDHKGRWRTHGRGSQATTRGTTWFSEERCDGTYTKVVKGSVLIRDHYIKRNIVLNAGERYLARPHKKYPPSVR